MKSAIFVAAVPALLASGANALACNADNCLRALRATNIPGRLQSAEAFCATYTAATTSFPAASTPTYAAAACVSNQVGPASYRISSACSCIASATTTSASSSTTPTATDACVIASSAWAQVSASAVPQIPASIAYACLQSVPLHKAEALEMVDSIEPYLDWQTDAAYKKDPPADYFYPGYDMYAALATVKANLQNDKYANEHDFQVDLYKTVFAPGHDGHFAYYPDLMGKVFDFGHPLTLVSISPDGSSLPEIKVYDDVVADASTASTLTHINGQDAVTFLEDLIFTASFNQDADSAYNSLFYEMAVYAVGDGTGYFNSSGRIRFFYQGANTTFGFANGTELTLENYANVRAPLTNITDGESMYQTFCTGQTFDSDSDSITDGQPPGFPVPVVSTNDAIVSCFFLEGEGYEDVAVISLLSFENEDTNEFQSVCAECYAKAAAAGKTKLVVDFSSNGGGYILLGYQFFRQLFPQVLQDGYSRWRLNDGFSTLAKMDSDYVAGVDPYTSDDSDLIDDYLWWFNYRYDLNLTNEPFETFDDKFAPHVFKDTEYTALMRWNLADNLTTSNDTFGMGFEFAGYGSLANLTQPFAAEDIVIVYDGICASTCTLASEFLRLQGGVKSVAFGGRPVEGPIQGVGGIKGAQTLSFSYVYDVMQLGLLWETGSEEQNAALSKYTETAITRSSTAAVNSRDQILRGNVEDGLPAQYVVEEADCRLYWTADMVTDVTAVWKAAAKAAFNGGKCAAGGIEYPAEKRSASSPSRIERGRKRDPSTFYKGHYDIKAIQKRYEGNEVAFQAKYNQKMIV